MTFGGEKVRIAWDRIVNFHTTGVVRCSFFVLNDATQILFSITQFCHEHRFTRQELYDRVWSKPMSHLQRLDTSRWCWRQRWLLDKVAPKPRPTQPTTMTPEELYGAVWTTPMSRLAEDYGITGNGLAKICDREDIPYPPPDAVSVSVEKQQVLTPPAERKCAEIACRGPKLDNCPL
jgi:hypothetical protein